jgi:L-lactate dehydrogenase (cytochrome)
VRPNQIAAMLQIRRPRVRRVDRLLDRCMTVDDWHTEACRRWPRGVRDYVDGGADGEVSLRHNREAIESIRFVPSILRDVGHVDTAVNLLGFDSALPLVLGPTGYTRTMHPDGELAAAAAARDAGIAYTLATMSTVSLDDVARDAGGELWFQLYMWRDRDVMTELLHRARAHGYRVLVLTVDTAVTGMRVRDHHNGFTLPPRLTPGVLLDIARHPGWCLGLLRNPSITFANFAADIGSRSQNIMEFSAQQFDPTVNWSDLEWLRTQWLGPIVMKGLIGPKDAVRARDAGVDALALSNHGGRQLDQTIPPIDMLPAVRAAVGDRMTLLVDSGIRRGTDVAIAVALGADACLLARAYLYGLGAAGKLGCAAVIATIADELRRAMKLLGVRSVDELRDRGADLVQRGPA